MQIIQDSLPITLSRTRSVLVMCAILVSAGACANLEPNEVSHPTPDNLPPRGSPTIRSEGVPLGLAAHELSAWEGIRDLLLAPAV